MRSEHSRELSRANKSLYEFLHPDEVRPGAGCGHQPRGDQGGRARIDRPDQGPARARNESGVALQHESARAGEAHAGALRSGESVHRRRRHHSGDLRARIDARNAQGGGPGVRAGARNSGGDEPLQQPREDERASAAGVGHRRGVSGFRAGAVDGRRLAHHDFEGAEPFRSLVELFEYGQAAVSRRTSRPSMCFRRRR